MKKEDIKKDLVKDKIISGIYYLSDNSKYVWGFLALATSAIILLSFSASKTNKKSLKSNDLLGVLQNRAIYDDTSNDSLLLSDFEFLLNSSLSNESYNQVMIYLLNHSIKSNDKTKVVSLLNENKFNSDDNMLNAFILKLQGDIASDDNRMSDAISYYSKASDLVPSYDLMVLYSITLINLYLEESNLSKANEVVAKILALTKDVENLSRNTQNNIDFIQYKLKQLNK